MIAAAADADAADHIVDPLTPEFAKTTFGPKFTAARLLLRAFELWSLVAQCDNDTKFVHCVKADD